MCVPQRLKESQCLLTTPEWYSVDPFFLTPFETSLNQVEGCSRALQDGEVLTLGDDIQIQCLHTPG